MGEAYKFENGFSCVFNINNSMWKTNSNSNSPTNWNIYIRIKKDYKDERFSISQKLAN